MKELVACLLGVKQTSPTDEGYVPTLFPGTIVYYYYVMFFILA
jgi:hypothetical protein